MIDSNIEKKKSRIFIKLIIIIIMLGFLAFGALFIYKIAPNYINNDITNKTNLVINFTNVTGRMKQEMIIDENNVVYLSIDDIRNYYDEYIYYDNEYNQIVTSSENKLAVLEINKNEMTVNGKKVKIKGKAQLINDIYYLPISDMEEVYNVKIDRPENKIVIESLDRELKVAKTSKKLNVKYKTTQLSRNIEKLEENDKVIIAQVAENSLPQGWVKVRTKNGNLGYIEEKYLTNINIEREQKTYEKQIDGKISLVWEYFSEYAKAPDNTGKVYDGVNVVSPSFFNMKLQNTNKENLTKLDVLVQSNLLENVGQEGENYINWAKQNGYKVWPKVTNDTLPSTIDEFSVIINDFKLRENIINQIKQYAQKYDLDGINLDFEFMYEKDKDAFSKFVIELAPQLRDMNVCLSVDVTAPDGSENWSLCYDRNVIGEVADYIVFMGYDQYGTNTIGTTSGYNWLKNSINKFMKYDEVPSEKIILGLPFYTKLWKTKNDKVVSSQVVFISYIENFIPDNATKEWKEDLQQYYIQYEKDGYVYKMWVEDEQSFEKKIKLVEEFNLAGAGYWRKGFEDARIWRVIKDNLNL